MSTNISTIENSASSRRTLGWLARERRPHINNAEQGKTHEKGQAIGPVTNIHVISGLSDGLIDRSIEVAQKIKFEPAIKDGHPGSMWFELQYNYHLF
jgi:hypothetical protein